MAIRNSSVKRLFELKKIGTAEASTVALPALKSNDELVRATAASAVVWLPGNEAVAVLLPLLADKSEFVRREGSLALGKVGDPTAALSLIQLAENEKVLEVKNAAIIALGNIGESRAIKPLVEILSEKPKEDAEVTRRSAARSIGQIAAKINNDQEPAVTPKNFLPLKYKEIEPEKNTAARSEYFTKVVPVLIKVLNNKKEAIDTRREAAAALGFIADPASFAAIKICSQSSDPYLAEICKEAILRFGDR